MTKPTSLLMTLPGLIVLALSGCGGVGPTAPDARASVSIEVGAKGCEAAHPIAANIANISKQQIDGVEFVIRGQQVGHSDFLANSGPIRTDKILAPGEMYSVCVDTPMVVRPAPADIQWHYTVEVSNVWGGESD